MGCQAEFRHRRRGRTGARERASVWPSDSFHLVLVAPRMAGFGASGRTGGAPGRARDDGPLRARGPPNAEDALMKLSTLAGCALALALLAMPTRCAHAQPTTRGI